MVNVNDQKELTAWLEKQPREIVWLFGARAAWRAWSAHYFSFYRGLSESTASTTVLPLFRGGASALVASGYPTSAAGRAAAAVAAAGLSTVSAATAVGLSAAAAARPSTAAAAGLSAAAAADAASVSASDSAAAAAADVAAVNAGEDARALSLRPLWPVEVPNWSNQYLGLLARALLAIDPGFSVWFDFYDALIKGGPRPHDAAFARAIDDLDLWKRPVHEINARLIELVEQERRDQLAAASSPEFYINDENQIDIRANAAFDAMPPGRKPGDVRSQLLEVLASLDGTLDRNASSLLRLNVRRYRRHLVRRRLTPDLQILRIQNELIKAEWNDTKEQGWATTGIREAFGFYFCLHDKFVALPRDAETRDPQIAAAKLDTAVIDDPNFKRVLTQLDVSFKELVDAEVATKAAGKAMEEITAAGKDLIATPEDRFLGESEVTPRKRYLYNLAGITSTFKKIAPLIVIMANAPAAWNSVLKSLEFLWSLISKF